MRIRTLHGEDIDTVVEFSLRAWAPVHASMAVVLGAELNARIYPDWAAGQATEIRNACADEAMLVDVAVDDADTPVGFVAVFIHDDGSSGEVDMIAVDPDAQRQGIAAALTEHAVRRIKAVGATLAVIATGGDDGHGPARRLYESRGFTGLPLVRYYRQL